MLAHKWVGNPDQNEATTGRPRTGFYLPELLTTNREHERKLIHRKMELPSPFHKRVQDDIAKLKGCTKIPLPTHIRNRSYILEAAKASSEQPTEAQQQRILLAEQQTRQLANKLQSRTDEIRRTLDTKVAEMWGTTHLGLIEHIICEADTVNGKEVADFIIKGVPTYAKLPETALFEVMSKAEQETFNDRQKKATAKFKVKEKTTLPQWATKAQLKEAFDTFLKKAKSPKEIDAPFDQLIHPVYCFPVRQGDRVFDKATKQWRYSKIRPCMDYRVYNCRNGISNRISYAGPGMVIRCCLYFLRVQPDYRLVNRKQVHANIEAGRLQVSTTNQAKCAPVTDTKLPPRQFAIAKTDITNFYYTSCLAPHMSRHSTP